MELLTRDRVRAKRRAATHSVATECYRFCLVVNLQAPENFLDFRVLVMELLGGIEPPTFSHPQKHSFFGDPVFNEQVPSGSA